MMNFEVSPRAAASIGLTIEAAYGNPRLASRRAAAKLRELGWTCSKSHVAWNRGMRWISPDGREQPNRPAILLLDWALAQS